MGTEELLRHWNRVRTEALSLQVFKGCVDVVLRDVV